MIKFQTKGLLRGKVLGVMLLSLAVCLMAAPSAKADVISLLGDAGPVNWAALSLGSDDTMDGGSLVGGLVVGNFGFQAPGNFGASGGSKVSGALVRDLVTQTVTLTGGSTVGSLVTNKPLVDAATSAATTAATNFKALGANQTFASVINSNTVISSTVAGQNVIALNGGVSLTGSSTLTFHATNPGDFFIVNVPTGEPFALTGTSKIGVDSSLSPLEVVFNLQGTSTYSVTAGEIDAIVLAAGANFILSTSQTGELIAHDITIHSGGNLFNPIPIPIPPTAILLGSGLLGLGFLGGRRKWFRKS